MLRNKEIRKGRERQEKMKGNSKVRKEMWMQDTNEM
jgi:hypothetical protein